MPNKDEAPLPKTGVQALDRFFSNVKDEDKWQAQLEKVQEITNQFNNGAPIPMVSAQDMKQMWDATRRMNADMPPRPNVATGLAVFAAYGLEAASAPDKFFPISWRHQLLSSVVKRGVLNDYKHGEELDEKVFEVAATMSCDKADVAEAMLLGGYNPEESNIGSKFLDLLRKNC